MVQHAKRSPGPRKREILHATIPPVRFAHFAGECAGVFFFALVFALGVSAPGPGPLVPFAVGGVYAALLVPGFSRGYLNPAIALAAALRGEIGSRGLLALWLAQGLGAALAVWAAFWLEIPQGQPFFSPPEGPALTFEFLCVAALCTLVLAPGRRTPMARAAVAGLFVTGTGLVGGSISGGVFNPAVAGALSGIGMLDPKLAWGYAGVGLAAGFASAIAAQMFRPTPQQKATTVPQAPKIQKPPTP